MRLFTTGADREQQCDRRRVRTLPVWHQQADTQPIGRQDLRDSTHQGGSPGHCSLCFHGAALVLFLSPVPDTYRGFCGGRQVFT